MDEAPETADLLEDWPLRPWVLGGLLALAGLLLHLVTDDLVDEEPWRASLAALVGFGGLGAAFTLNRKHPVSAAIFASIIGLVMAGIAWHVVAAQAHRAGVEYAFAAGCFFSLLALPLFQAGFHRTRFATDYSLTHFHVWADAISGGGALAFTGLSWIMLVLLDQLFGLVGIDLIGDLMDEGWFGWMWSGAAFGAGLGVIRNNLKIVGTLQSVVMLVFALLAVPLAVALLVFLAALLASGGQALWNATDSATPILLACAMGSFILFNTIIRDSDEARSNNRIMQIAALVLAAGILPLGIFAAISMGIRVDQYGLAPERIWGLIAVAVACAYGLACWVALLRGRKSGWSLRLREANLHLAAGVCLLALVLALPLWDFGAMSARNQLSRLETGKVSVADFDYAALRWDFGDAGREALAELAAGEGEVAELAADAQAQEVRPFDRGIAPVAERTPNLRGVPEDEEAEDGFAALLRAEPWRCRSTCRVLELEAMPDGRRRFVLVEDLDVSHFALAGEGGLDAFYPSMEDGALSLAADPPPADATVEVRPITMRQVYVDGRPVGAPFADGVRAGEGSQDDEEGGFSSEIVRPSTE